MSSIIMTIDSAEAGTRKSQYPDKPDVSMLHFSGRESDGRRHNIRMWGRMAVALQKEIDSHVLPGMSVRDARLIIEMTGETKELQSERSSGKSYTVFEAQKYAVLTGPALEMQRFRFDVARAYAHVEHLMTEGKNEAALEVARSFLARTADLGPLLPSQKSKLLEEQNIKTEQVPEVESTPQQDETHGVDVSQEAQAEIIQEVALNDASVETDKPSEEIQADEPVSHESDISQETVEISPIPEIAAVPEHKEEIADELPMEQDGVEHMTNDIDAQEKQINIPSGKVEQEEIKDVQVVEDSVSIDVSHETSEELLKEKLETVEHFTESESVDAGQKQDDIVEVVADIPQSLSEKDIGKSAGMQEEKSIESAQISPISEHPVVEEKAPHLVQSVPVAISQNNVTPSIARPGFVTRPGMRPAPTAMARPANISAPLRPQAPAIAPRPAVSHSQPMTRLAPQPASRPAVSLPRPQTPAPQASTVAARPGMQQRPGVSRPAVAPMDIQMGRRDTPVQAEAAASRTVGRRRGGMLGMDMPMVDLPSESPETTAARELGVNVRRPTVQQTVRPTPASFGRR
jgi:hypothetical protein